jgi:hypothetical protein
MDQVKKSDLLKYAKNEYFATILAAKVARRLHATMPEKRPDPKAKVTSLALKLITNGQVEYAERTPVETPVVEASVEQAPVESAPVAEPEPETVVKPKRTRKKAAEAEATEEE